MVRTSLLFAAALVSAVAVHAQSVDDIIAKDIQARGGLEKLKAVQSMKMTGKMSVGSGMEAPIVLRAKRPDALRMDFTFQGMTASQAFDGKSGWQIMPFNGKKDAEALPPDELKDIEEQADFDGPLVDYKAKGNKVELIGKEKIEGTDAYNIKVTLKNGDIRNIYIDADSYLPVREASKRQVRGADQEVETSMGDYKDVQGLMFPMSMESSIKGNPQTQKITVDVVELNPPVEDAIFKMPAPSAAPAATEKAEPTPNKTAPATGTDKKPDVPKDTPKK